MESKIFKLNFKEVSESGKFSGYLSTFGNVDSEGDIIQEGAFRKSLAENKAFPLIWSHSRSDPRLIIGSFHGEEDKKGLRIDGEFFDDPDSQNAYRKIKQLFERGVKVGLSMGFKTIKDSFVKIGDTIARVIKEAQLFEGSFTLFPANPLAQLESIKAEWDRAYINDLPDSAFAVIEPAYLKGETEDKRARHLPHHNKNGEIDLPHLRNALARMNQIIPITDSISTSELRQKAEAHLVAHAKKLGIGDWEKDELPNYELKPYPNEHACRLNDPDKYERFARMTRRHNGKEYSVIIGFKKGGGSEDQAYRYPKDTWSAEEARAHCKEHGGQFEPASEKMEIVCSSCGERMALDIEPPKGTQDEPPDMPEPEDIYSAFKRIADELKK